jgi:hypothetical protein
MNKIQNILIIFLLLSIIPLASSGTNVAFNITATGKFYSIPYPGTNLSALTDGNFSNTWYVSYAPYNNFIHKDDYNGDVCNDASCWYLNFDLGALYGISTINYKYDMMADDGGITYSRIEYSSDNSTWTLLAIDNTSSTAYINSSIQLNGTNGTTMRYIRATAYNPTQHSIKLKWYEFQAYTPHYISNPEPLYNNGFGGYNSTTIQVNYVGGDRLPNYDGISVPHLIRFCRIVPVSVYDPSVLPGLTGCGDTTTIDLKGIPLDNLPSGGTSKRISPSEMVILYAKLINYPNSGSMDISFINKQTNTRIYNYHTAVGACGGDCNYLNWYWWTYGYIGHFSWEIKDPGQYQAVITTSWGSAYYDFTVIDSSVQPTPSPTPTPTATSSVGIPENGLWSVGATVNGDVVTIRACSGSVKGYFYMISPVTFLKKFSTYIDPNQCSVFSIPVTDFGTYNYGTWIYAIFDAADVSQSKAFGNVVILAPASISSDIVYSTKNITMLYQPYYNNSNIVVNYKLNIAKTSNLLIDLTAYTYKISLINPDGTEIMYTYKDMPTTAWYDLTTIAMNETISFGSSNIKWDPTGGYSIRVYEIYKPTNKNSIIVSSDFIVNSISGCNTDPNALCNQPVHTPTPTSSGNTSIGTIDTKPMTDGVWDLWNVTNGALSALPDGVRIIISAFIICYLAYKFMWIGGFGGFLACLALGLIPGYIVILIVLLMLILIIFRNKIPGYGDGKQ